MIKAIIFDLDGVITNTAEYHYLAWNKLASDKGLIFSRSLNERLKGISRISSLEIILEENNISLSTSEKEEWAILKNDLYLKLITKISPNDLFSKVEELFTKLKEKDIKIALGSASKNAKQVVKQLGIEQYFDCIGDGFSVLNSKPAPDIFLYVSEQLKLMNNECIVVEDADAGISAAKKAGMKVVGIGKSNSIRGEADYTFAQTGDINLDIILN